MNVLDDTVELLERARRLKTFSNAELASELLASAVNLEAMWLRHATNLNGAQVEILQTINAARQRLSEGQ